ncbi:MAG: c-type cytochrome [Chitinophagaceae bacterium]|nr:c-type cytochrome [Chitinophagaceae bacterium]MCW5925733.1 c-type cytochrome [Chitinophagaceae bacterium]
MVLNVDSIRGQVLFRADCSMCHPSKARLHYNLEGVVDRPGEPYLKRYLTKQDSLLAAKDPYATTLIEVYNGVRGNHRFPYSDDELNYIIAYLR